MAGQGARSVIGLESLTAMNTLILELSLKRVATQPTVFVSHQQSDAAWAEWVAWAATEAHFDYWLDIHDPKLMAANSLPPHAEFLVFHVGMKERRTWFH
jgi:hypothetical protein